MFILSSILNTYNDSTRKGRTSRKDRTCKGKACRTRQCFRYSKARSSKLFQLGRFSQSYESIRSKSKQCTLYTKESRIRLYLSLIPLFIFYNPYILIAIIYIDMLFADELIYINAMLINVIIESLQRFNNIGVV